MITYPPPINDGGRGGFDESARKSSTYFTDVVNASGEVVSVDTSRIAELSQEDAVSVINKALLTQKSEGKTDGFKYRSYSVSGSYLSIYFFLDTSMQTNSVIRLLVLSVLIGTLCLVLMLIPVIILSKKAIKPIAVNMEKQRRFVTDAGHELKTPLAIILANTEAMELHMGESKWSKNIRQQIFRLTSLMQSLLTLAKADESTSSCDKGQVCISEIVVSTVKMFKEAMELKKICFESEIEPDIQISANKEMITNLVSILSDNAVKYAKDGGFVSAKLFKSGKGVTFIMANNCETLPECSAEKLFDRFYRNDEARTQKSGGCGIGLSAARSIVQSHSGTISAHYEKENVIVFTVSLPA